MDAGPEDNEFWTKYESNQRNHPHPTLDKNVLRV